MANSADILIANEIVTGLNGQAFSQAFTAERVYAADWDLKSELNDLQVGVWLGESNADVFERRLLLKSYRTGISIAKKVSAATVSEIDALCDLVTEVLDFLELTVVELGDGRQYVNQGWEYLLRFDDTALDRNKGADGTVKYTGLFASVIVFDFVSQE